MKLNIIFSYFDMTYIWIDYWEQYLISHSRYISEYDFTNLKHLYLEIIIPIVSSNIKHSS